MPAAVDLFDLINVFHARLVLRSGERASSVHRGSKGAQKRAPTNSVEYRFG